MRKWELRSGMLNPDIVMGPMEITGSIPNSGFQHTTYQTPIANYSLNSASFSSKFFRVVCPTYRGRPSREPDVQRYNGKSGRWRACRAELQG